MLFWFYRKAKFNLFLKIFWCHWILHESYPIMHSAWYHSSSNSDLGGYVQKSQTTSRNIIQGWNQETNDVLEKDNSFTFRSFALNFGVHFVKVLKKYIEEIKPFIQFHEETLAAWGIFLNILWTLEPNYLITYFRWLFWNLNTYSQKINTFLQF